ncbi:PKD domain-containing protein [Nocardioides sp. URHA0020]|uniref:PKD domain-containing protein n=1 Tax=Nocardioides sp. URHA0020 TaxID=1380392 RepID=UPI0012DF1565|nr:PKD domain-containing protein [Nocardioides sp. URHA0020]
MLNHRRSTGQLIGIATVAAVLIGSLTPLAATSADAATVPDTAPSAATPQVKNGATYAITEVGSTMVLGGTFTQAANYGANQPTVDRSYVLAFDRDSGQLSSTFAPVLDGIVNDVEPGPTAGTVYVAGAFTTVNGTKNPKLVLLNTATGAVVPSFKAPAMNGVISSIDVADGRLYVGGLFTVVGGVTHGGIATLNAGTGALDPFVNIQLAQRHNDTGGGAQGGVGVKELDVASTGQSMVVVGNFKTADGLARDQVFQADLTGPSAVVRTDWKTRRYEPYCFNWAYDSYMRSVTYSPDGSYFVIGTTGGKNNGTLCDSATRWETNGSGQELQPTWADYAGGDTIWAVEVANDVVYAGGHQRWMNNGDGNDYAGQGAVPRPGLAALDSTTGVPLSWNPGRNPRGAAVFDIYAGSKGLYLGSDTEWIGNFAIFRPRIAMFPYATGSTQKDDAVASLPADVLTASTSGDTLTRRTFDGTTAGAASTVATGDGWSSARGGFYAGGNLYYGRTDGYLYKRSWDGRVLGAATKIDPYLDPAWVGVDTGSNSVYNGRLPDLYGSLNSTQALAYSNERIYYATSNSSTLRYRYFSTDSDIVGSEVFTVSSSIDFRRVGGMFVSDGYLYYVSTTSGNLSRIAFDGAATSGSATTVSTADWRNRALWLAPTFNNQPPTAQVTASCSDLVCSFDAAGSTDPDGTIASYAWDFGDGSSDTGATVQHTYAAGSYTATVTLTDDLGGTTVVQKQVAPTAPATSTIGFVGSAQGAYNAQNVSLATPSSTQAGDQLMLFVSGGVTDPGATLPGGGWTLLGSRVNNGLWSGVYSRTATASDSTTSVPVSFNAVIKSTLVLAAYRDVNATVAGSAIGSSITSSSATHVAPTVTAPSGAWLATYWTDKSGTTTAWTLPATTTTRSTAYGTGTGRVTAALVDSNATVAPGTVGGLTATTDAPSTRGVAWTIALAPK